ncbi:hypothetical protein E6O75_ATG07258 [Venturia nashicola]|uniref:Uncharacterized protein n=1 Tax=Venturia nashicola TaxID=86259 RepID=A0A4Z1P2P6_9PEZI|nr:hypothetical protein E6O75_ATG07258 [Venturia nashicola]
MTAPRRAEIRVRRILRKLRLRRTRIEKVAGQERRPTRRTFRRRKRIPGTNVKVTVPSTDGAAEEYYAESFAITNLNPPLPPPAMKSERHPRLTGSVEKYPIDRFGNDAAFAHNPAPAPNDPNVYHPPGSQPLSKRGTFKNMYRKVKGDRKVREEEKERKEPRPEVKEAKKNVKAEKKQAYLFAKFDKALATRATNVVKASSA